VSDEGNEFDKIRLRAYALPLIYTIDVGETDGNPFGMYVGWQEPIQVYNRETGETRQIESGDENGVGQSGQQTSGDRPPPDKRQNGMSKEQLRNADWDELTPMQKVKRAEHNVRQRALSDRPQLLARLAKWKQNLPDEARSACDDLISEYATQDAYDARLEEIDQELETAEREYVRHGYVQPLAELCQQYAEEASVWPPDYREPARVVIKGHAPDGFDVEKHLYQGNRQPA
jgi:hypothetical protein